MSYNVIKLMSYLNIINSIIKFNFLYYSLLDLTTIGKGTNLLEITQIF